MHTLCTVKVHVIRLENVVKIKQNTLIIVCNVVVGCRRTNRNCVWNECVQHHGNCVHIGTSLVCDNHQSYLGFSEKKKILNVCGCDQIYLKKEIFILQLYHVFHIWTRPICNSGMVYVQLISN
jgi:hypothetical protein